MISKLYNNSSLKCWLHQDLWCPKYSNRFNCHSITKQLRIYNRKSFFSTIWQRLEHQTSKMTHFLALTRNDTTSQTIIKQVFSFKTCLRKQNIIRSSWFGVNEIILCQCLKYRMNYLLLEISKFKCLRIPMDFLLIHSYNKL